MDKNNLVLIAFLVCKSTLAQILASNTTSRPLKAVPRLQYQINWTSSRGYVGHWYILFALNHLTKWVEAALFASASEKATSLFLLQHVFLCHGSPRELLLDNVLNL